MDLSRQRSRRPGGPNPPPCQGTQGRTRRSGRSSTPQVHAPVEITAHEWRSKSGAARPPSQTRHSSDTGPRDWLRGPVSRAAGPRHASTREGGRQRRGLGIGAGWDACVRSVGHGRAVYGPPCASRRSPRAARRPRTPASVCTRDGRRLRSTPACGGAAQPKARRCARADRFPSAVSAELGGFGKDALRPSRRQRSPGVRLHPVLSRGRAPGAQNRTREVPHGQHAA